MKQVPEGLKSWVEFLEKTFLVVTLIVGLVTSGFKAKDYFSAQEKQVQAKTKTIDLLTNTYTDLIGTLNKEIAQLDEKMKDEVWKNSVGWEKFLAIREMKVKDRNELLHTLGVQIMELKKFER